VVRNPQNLPPARARIVTADLGSADPAALQSAVDGADAVLSGLGSRSKAEVGKGRRLMPDPVISSVAAVVAAKAAEAAVQGGKDACVALVRLVRERFGRDKEATAALEMARGDPEDEAAVAGLVQALERLVSADGDFAARIREFSNHL
jgi:hypothetical protein